MEENPFEPCERANVFWWVSDSRTVLHAHFSGRIWRLARLGIFQCGSSFGGFSAFIYFLKESYFRWKIPETIPKDPNLRKISNTLHICMAFLQYDGVYVDQVTICDLPGMQN